MQKCSLVSHQLADEIIGRCLKTYRVEIIDPKIPSHWKRVLIKAPDSKTARFLAQYQKHSFQVHYRISRSRVDLVKQIK